MKQPNPNSYWNGLKAFLFQHLKQLPYILLYPIMAVVNLLFSITSQLYHWLNDRFNELVLGQKRLTRLTRKAVQTVLSGHSNIMSSFWALRVCYFFTFLLQFLSFLTTYAGFTFFLKHINPFAPLILALVVQGTFYYLINFRSSRKRDGNWKRMVLLAIVLLVSTTTSFVGVSNAVRSPVNDMKETYEGYRAVHNEYLENQVNRFNAFTEDDISAALNACTKVRGNVAGTLQVLKKAIPDSTASTSQTPVTTGYRPDGTPIISMATSTTSNTTLEEIKKQLEGLISTVDNAYQNLTTDPSQLSAKTIYQACIADPQLPAQRKIHQEFLDCLNEHAALERLLLSVPVQQANIFRTTALTQASATIDVSKFSISALTDYHKSLQQQNTAKLDDYNTLTSVSPQTDSTPVTQIAQILSDLDQLLISPDLSRAESIRTQLNQTMAEKYALLSAAGRSYLADSYQAAHLPSSQLYPFRYLAQFSASDWGSSLLSLILAAIIDLLSLILSFTLIKRRDSILYAKNHKEDVRNREELLEDCYTYLCMREIISQSPRNIPRTAASIQSFVSRKIEDIMYQFISQVHIFHIPDSLDSFGYLVDNAITEGRWERTDLFQTLRLIHLIRPVTYPELLRLLEAEFPDPSDPTKTSLPAGYGDTLPKDTLLYLVDNRLLMWHNENFSELLQGSLLSDDFQLFPPPPPSAPPGPDSGAPGAGAESEEGDPVGPRGKPL